MQAIGRVSAVFAGLVHSQARHTPLLNLRHRTFIVSKLCFAALTLAAAPVFVALRGVPTREEAAIFALALLQLAAAMLVSRTGRLVAAQRLGVLGFIGVGLAASLLPSGAASCATAWFIAAAVDQLADERPLHPVAFIGGAALLGAVAVGQTHRPMGVGAALLAVAAAVPVLQAAWRGRQIVEAASEAARDAEAHRRFLVEAGGRVVLDLDGYGLVNRASPNCRALIGIDGDALHGRGLFEHIQVADRPAFLKLVSDAAHEPGVRVAAVRLRRDTSPAFAAAGPIAPRYVTVEVRAARDPAGQGVVALIEDVEGLRRAEAARDDARHLVAEATRSRDEFLANISHELRTPLNAVIGFSEMLASQTLRPVEAGRQREYAQIILQSGQHLLSVVNDILDMSKIQSGTFALTPERFDIAQLVRQCHDMMQLKAGAGRVTLRDDVPRGIGSLVGDRRACKQILINLLSNAVKFTPENGEVSVAARVEGTALRLAVSDTGIGVAATDLAKLGQPFFQVNGSLCRSHEGTGLGLSVVRGLVELHGGDLAIASEPGRGTTVTVRLPLLGAPYHGVAPAPASDIARLPARHAPLSDRIKRSA